MRAINPNTPIPQVSHQLSTIYLNLTQTQTHIIGAQKNLPETKRRREEERERESRRSGFETQTSAKNHLPEAFAEGGGHKPAYPNRLPCLPACMVCRMWPSWPKSIWYLRETC